ncbi:MAG TPA: SPASM domain-containing protein, partial [Tepidisphaeraceae bacterium]
PQRKACARIQSRMMVLCDGRIVSCEQDITGRQVMGRVGKDEVGDVWKRMFGQLREEHGQGRWAQRPVCASCKDWHRR